MPKYFVVVAADFWNWGEVSCSKEFFQVAKMSKQTGNVAFRRLDVDAIGDEVYHDDEEDVRNILLTKEWFPYYFMLIFFLGL